MVLGKVSARAACTQTSAACLIIAGHGFAVFLVRDETYFRLIDSFWQCIFVQGEEVYCLIMETPSNLNNGGSHSLVIFPDIPPNTIGCKEKHSGVLRDTRHYLNCLPIRRLEG